MPSKHRIAQGAACLAQGAVWVEPTHIQQRALAGWWAGFRVETDALLDGAGRPHGWAGVSRREPPGRRPSGAQGLVNVSGGKWADERWLTLVAHLGHQHLLGVAGLTQGGCHQRLAIFSAACLTPCHLVKVAIGQRRPGPRVTN